MKQEGMRLDELARRAEVATTTVRLYQHRGLLAGPRLVGRTGWYDASHLARLRLISRLQDEGYSLAGIGRLLESWEQGRDLSDIVGVERELDALFGGPSAVTLEPGELAGHFPLDALTPALLARAVGAGLVTPTDDGRFRVPDRRFVATGGAFARLGVPLEIILDEWEHLVVHTDAIADRFLSLFEAHLLPDGWRPDHDVDPDAGTDTHAGADVSAGSVAGTEGDQVQVLASTLAQLRGLAGQVVLAALHSSMAQVGGRRLAGLIPATVGPAGIEPATKGL